MKKSTKTILALAAVAGAVWYFTRPKEEVIIATEKSNAVGGDGRYIVIRKGWCKDTQTGKFYRCAT